MTPKPSQKELDEYIQQLSPYQLSWELQGLKEEALAQRLKDSLKLKSKDRWSASLERAVPDILVSVQLFHRVHRHQLEQQAELKRLRGGAAKFLSLFDELTPAAQESIAAHLADIPTAGADALRQADAALRAGQCKRDDFRQVLDRLTTIGQPQPKKQNIAEALGRGVAGALYEQGIRPTSAKEGIYWCILRCCLEITKIGGDVQRISERVCKEYPKDAKA